MGGAMFGGAAEGGARGGGAPAGGARGGGALGGGMGTRVGGVLNQGERREGRGGRGGEMRPTGTGTPRAYAPHRHTHPTGTCTPQPHVPCSHMHPTATIPCKPHAQQAPDSMSYMWVLGMAIACAMAMKWGRGIMRWLGRKGARWGSGPNHNEPTLILKARQVGRVRHSRTRWPPRFRPARGRYRRYRDRVCKSRGRRGTRVDSDHTAEEDRYSRSRVYPRSHWRPPAWWYLVGMLMLVVTAWGGGTEQIARGGQIGQIGQRRQRGSGGRVRQTEAEAAAESGRRKRPEGQVAESSRQRNVTYVRGEMK